MIEAIGFFVTLIALMWIAIILGEMFLWWAWPRFDRATSNRVDSTTAI